MAKDYYSELYFHFVWRTKNSQKFILPGLQKPIWNQIVRKASELGADPIEIGGIEDHVHLLVSTEPSVLLSEFIGKVKGSTSHWVNHDLHAPRVFQWAVGYGVLSLAKRDVPGVRSYIRNQNRHHDRNSFNATMERCDRLDA